MTAVTAFLSFGVRTVCCERFLIFVLSFQDGPRNRSASSAFDLRNFSAFAEAPKWFTGTFISELAKNGQGVCHPVGHLHLQNTLAVVPPTEFRFCIKVRDTIAESFDFATFSRIKTPRDGSTTTC